MIRTILKSDQKDLTISLPDDLVGKLIEVIAFELEDKPTESLPSKPKPSQLRGFLSEEGSQKLQKHISQSRQQWGTY